MDLETTARSFYDTINTGNLEAFGALIADGFVEHEETARLPADPGGRPRVVRRHDRAAFPDLRFDVEELLPSGDKVVVRARFRGTHQGEFMGMPATGKAVDVASSTSWASAATASSTSTGASSTRWR